MTDAGKQLSLRVTRQVNALLGLRFNQMVLKKPSRRIQHPQLHTKEWIKEDHMFLG